MTAKKTTTKRTAKKATKKPTGKRLFGTDGVRGRANVYPMTGELLFNLGRAVAFHFRRTRRRRREGGPLVIIGKDTRRSGYAIEHAFSAGVCSQGGEVVLTGPLPTPGVAFVTVSMRADAGVMISASHNSFEDNGVKIFDCHGFKLPDEAELELERLALDPSLMDTKLGESLGRAKRLKEVYGRYLVHAKSAFSDEFDLEGFRIVLDCSHGAAYKVGPMIFSELGAEVIPLGVEPDGTNINVECGTLHPEPAREAVLQYRADLGVCLDGDADRFLAIDGEGRCIDGDKVIALFARFLVDTGKARKGDVVVGTQMSNMGLERHVRNLGLSFARTKVGDRYIIEKMQEVGSFLGGEPSGHILLRSHTTTGDGALCALKFLECMRHYKKKASELVGDVELFPQSVRSVKVATKPPLEDVPAVGEAARRAEGELGEGGRVLLRYSGTEPLIRIMVEGRDRRAVERASGRLLEAVGRELS